MSPEGRRHSPEKYNGTARENTRAQPVQAPPGRVTSGFVIKQLVVDGLLSAADAERFKITGGSARSGHPLVVLAEMNYRSPQADRQLLDLETLTRWIAEKAGTSVLSHRSAES